MAEAPPGRDIYTHGHHDAVLRSHRWRTAANSAAYLLPRLKPGMQLLDVGCGPGTLTVDLARQVAPARVVGIDSTPAVLAEASASAEESGVTNVEFEVGDAYELQFRAAAFDVVHAHQLLQHLSNPIAALVEMRRVLRPGGLLAVRDSDYGGFVWFPRDPLLDRWLALYHEVTTRNGAEADAGRHLLDWVQRAGFENASASSSTWTFTGAASRQWWSELWAERVAQSAFAEQADAYGLTDAEELTAIAAAWRQWGRHTNAVFIVVHGEVLAER